MTLFDLLTAMCFFMPFASAISHAHGSHVGFWGWLLELAGGFVLGAAFGISIWFVIGWAGRWILAQSKRKRAFGGVLLFVTIFVWIVGAALTGDWVSAGIIRSVS
jgi:NhaP-type Na+/H+ or K+/H+ antiporter